MPRRASIPLIAPAAALAAMLAAGPLVAPPAIAQQPPAQGAQASTGVGMEERMMLLEERIRDMQAVIGTLQSFSGGSAAAPGAQVTAAPGGEPAGAPSELSIRVLALETQIRALTNQMSEIIDRLDQGGAPPGQTPPWQQGTAQEQPLPPWQQGSAAPVAVPQQLAPAYPAPEQQQGQFASAAEPPRQLGQVAEPAPASPYTQQQADPQQTAQLPSFSGLSGSTGARGIYDASYQSFVRNDLESAERGFSNFVTSYPDDPLATNAYYWLGRAHYDRQQYEPAAKAFLAGYKKDKKSAIAPDSLLHLGLSLANLGEREAACSTLSAVPKQYPEAPAKLKEDAAAAMKQARC